MVFDFWTALRLLPADVRVFTKMKRDSIKLKRRR